MNKTENERSSNGWVSGAIYSSNKAEFTETCEIAM